MAGLAIVLALSLGTIFYGAWLNERGEFQIARRMEDRRVVLHGERAAYRSIRPRVIVKTLNLDTDTMADAVALVEGRITDCLVGKGSTVRKGDTLFQLENEDIPLQIKEAESNILRAQATLRQAENNYHRYEVLKSMDAASAQQYDDAEANYYSAMAALQVAESKLEQLRVKDTRQSVAAPIDGRVLMMYRQKGAYVQSGTPLALVGNFDVLHFKKSVEDKVARYLSIGQEVELSFQSRDFKKVYGADYESGNLGSRQIFTAAVTEIRPPLSEPAAIRSIIWQVDNSSGLLEPQAYGEVTVQSRRGYNVLAVPVSAMADNSNDDVFVVGENGVVEQRKVVTGMDDGEYIEILSGLKEGEVVVTGGTEGLSDGFRAEIVLDDDRNGGVTQ